MKEFWEQRYRDRHYIYGVKPNTFFAERLSNINPGKLLLPAEGEGRNAVYAALNGWYVTAFDYSEEGRNKAIALADKNSVSINYKACELLGYKTNEQFDTVALIYAHFAGEERDFLFKNLQAWIKPGGKLIIEVFSKQQLGRSSGGPKDPDLLYSLDDFRIGLGGFKFDTLSEKEIVLDEGIYHNGSAWVIQAVATRK